MVSPLLIRAALAFLAVPQLAHSSPATYQYVEALEKEVARLSEELKRLESGGCSVRRTRSGAEFRRSEHPGLGEAWTDPSGVTWGAVVTHPYGGVRKMTQAEAAAYCRGLSAELPTLKDLVRLAGYMGGGQVHGPGYVPQVLPALAELSGCGTDKNLLWGAGTHPHPESQGFKTYFNTRSGKVSYARGGQGLPVRCVARPGR